MTRGEVAVVAVRGRALVDALAAYVALRRRFPAQREWETRSILIDAAADVVWEAQRVESAATKALGTRRR